MKTSLQHPPSMMAAEDLLGARIAARLDAGTQDLPYEVSERLRAARMQALAKRKVVAAVRTAPAVVHQGGGAAALQLGGGDHFSLWGRLASALPLLALVAGLFVIQAVLDDDRVNEIAEVDAALLTDDLPPQAYSDPGFVQFLKTQAAEAR